MLGFQDIDKSVAVNGMNLFNQRGYFIGIDHRIQDDSVLRVEQSFPCNCGYRVMCPLADKVIDLVRQAGDDEKGFLLVCAVQ